MGLVTVYVCDECGKTEQFEGPHHKIKTKASTAGWSTKHGKNGWEQVCPDCMEKYADNPKEKKS